MVPDVFVRKSGGGWIAALNPDVMPRLRINDMYAQILRGAKGETGTAGLQQKLQGRGGLSRTSSNDSIRSCVFRRQLWNVKRTFSRVREIAMRPLVFCGK